MDVSAFLVDTLSSRSLQSAVPEVTQREECCMGIDEAGRGPVLGQPSRLLSFRRKSFRTSEAGIELFILTYVGPMVYGTAFCPLAMKDAVKDLGVAGKGEGNLWCSLFRVSVPFLLQIPRL